MIRYDFFVVDNFGDVWNDEPLPTFKQANDFRGMIRPQVNRICDLRITSVVRGNSNRIQVERKTPAYEGSDF